MIPQDPPRAFGVHGSSVRPVLFLTQHVAQYPPGVMQETGLVDFKVNNDLIIGRVLMSRFKYRCRNISIGE